MATKKKATAAASAKKSDQAAGPQITEAYEKAIKEFAAAVALMAKRDFRSALSQFEALSKAETDEPMLSERARSYARICAERLAEAPPDPASAEERYYRAVVLSNAGDTDAAIKLLDQALGEDPSSARYLYARASAYALKGHADAAIGDLRQAIIIEPTVRFQAANDTDFEQIREEPSFIDIIEPTPTGA